MILFIFWIILSILVGKYWQYKGLGFGSGVLLSILLSPIIGFLIGVLKKPDIKKQEESKIKEGVMKKCPHCAEFVKIEARVCRYCGKDV